MTVFGGRFGRALGMLAVMGLRVAGGASAQAGKQATDKLRVYFIDVEGGQSTLFVTPAGQSLMSDTGWPGNSYRDAERIAAAAKLAGWKRIDYVLITHFHVDHVGGVPQLVERIPVGTFIDHGPNRELDKGVTEHGYAEYQKVLAAGECKHIVVGAGKTLPISGMKAPPFSPGGKPSPKLLPAAGSGKPCFTGAKTR